MWIWLLATWVAASFPLSLLVGAVIRRHPPQPVDATRQPAHDPFVVAPTLV
jgi:hypothetical protein